MFVNIIIKISNITILATVKIAFQIRQLANSL